MTYVCMVVWYIVGTNEAANLPAHCGRSMQECGSMSHSSNRTLLVTASDGSFKPVYGVIKPANGRCRVL